jgi:hypothetical protein
MKLFNIRYPVIDTASKPGYICDRGIGKNVPEMICTSLGFKGGGMRMPTGVYGNPEAPNRPLFVMQKIACSGKERSVFECDLGAWGNHADCQDEEILAVACAKQGSEEKLKFEPDVALAGGSIALAPPTGSEIAVINTGFGIVPVCAWSDPEADFLCRQRGYDCGMLNRTLKYELPTDTQGVLAGVFADIKCNEMGASEKRNLLDCNVTLVEECPASAAGMAASVWCLASTANKPDLDLCKLLREESGSDSNDNLAGISTIDIEINTNQGNCNETTKSTMIYVGGDRDGQAFSLWENQFIDLKITANGVYSHSYVTDRIDDDLVKGCREQKVSRGACRKQCRATLAESVCDCVPWYLSRARPDAKVCAGQGIGCLARIVKAMNKVANNVTVAESMISRAEMKMSDADRVRKSCRCLRPCDGAVDYSVVTVDRTTCDGTTGRGRVSLVLDRAASVLYLRRMVSVWEVVLGSVGGIMAIFVGFSFVCIVEVVYFLTIRNGRRANSRIDR